MIIACDIDDVLAELVPTWLDVYNQKNDDDLEKWEVLDWNIGKYTKIGDRFYDLLCPELYDRIEVVKNSLESINLLRKMGHRIIFVTSSAQNYMGRKLKWLIYNKFIDCSRFQPDYIECTDKNLIIYDLIIDDNVKNINEAVKNGKLAILFTQPWNLRYENSSIFYHRAENWKTIISLIEKMGTKSPLEQVNKDNYDLSLGGVKLDSDKPTMSYLPPLPMMELAFLAMQGAKKYQPRNWEKGMRFGRIYDALCRHALLWLAGNDKDEETGIHHLIAVGWNAIILRELCITHPEMDDRQKYDSTYIDQIKNLYKKEKDEKII